MTTEEIQREEEQQSALEEGLLLITVVYAAAYATLYKMLLQHFSINGYTQSSTSTAKHLLRAIIRDLDSQVALGSLRATTINIGVINAIYGVEDYTAVNRLGMYLGMANRNIENSVNRAIIDLGGQHLMLNSTTNATLRGMLERQLSDKMLKQYLDQNITAFIDKRGYRWQIETYVEMATKTVLHNIQVEAMQAHALTTGNDLARIPFHSKTKDACMQWQGKVISMTGMTSGYMTYNELKGTGHIFHVRCKHLPIPIIP